MMNDVIDILRQPGSVVCRPPRGKRLKIFSNPQTVIVASDVGDVIPALTEVERHLHQKRHVAGFISYEAAAAFDQAHLTHRLHGFPLCWFGVYDHPGADFPLDVTVPLEAEVPPALDPEISKSRYLRDLDTLKRHIRNGDVYQANYTFRNRGPTIKRPEATFLALTAWHPVPYPAFVNAGKVVVISNSPELFLERRGPRLRSLPMKGTAPRVLRADRDQRASVDLAKDPKNQAENVMIVDMVRHDFGKICRFGSIRVEPLFHVDAYPTVHQMISGVHGQLRDGAGLVDVLAATFPPASITGAPKIRAMEIIHDLEASPRKVYTGAVGCFAPNGDFLLNVAIRTLVLAGDRAELGVGSGVVADSQPEAEWDESILKGRFVAARPPPEFDVLETILWRRSSGLVFLKEHLRRARNSQRHFGRPWRKKAVDRALGKVLDDVRSGDAELARVRLRVESDGAAVAEFVKLGEKGWGDAPLTVNVSENRLDSKNPFLYHKTTHRSWYDEAFAVAKAEGFDEILFLNENDHLTEGAISNVFVQRSDGRWVTPAVDEGLLPGVWREEKLRELRAAEGELTLEDLKNARLVIIGNSVRGTGTVAKVHWRPMSRGKSTTYPAKTGNKRE